MIKEKLLLSIILLSSLIVSAGQSDWNHANPDTWGEKGFDLTGAKVAGAFRGSASNKLKDGSYIKAGMNWQNRQRMGKKLYPGRYKMFARMKGKGIFRLRIENVKNKKVRHTFPDCNVDTDKLTLFELGEFGYKRDYSMLLTDDKSTPGLWVDYIYVRGISDMTPEKATQRADAIRSKAANLKVLLDEAQGKGLAVGEQNAVYAVAMRYVQYGQDDVARGGLIRGTKVFDYLDKSVPNAIAEVRDIIAKGWPKAGRKPDYTNLSIKRSHLYNGEVPVYLTSIAWAPSDIITSLELNWRYHFNGFFAQAKDPLHSDEYNTKYHEGILNGVGKGVTAGLATTQCMHTHHKFPYLKKYPETRYIKPVQGTGPHNPCFETNYCHDTPISKEAYEQTVKKVLRKFDKAGLWSFEFFNEPGYACQCEYTMDKFRYYLNREYITIDKLNESWGKNYKDFNEVKKTDLSRQGANNYDWLDFNQERFYEMVSWRKNLINRLCPGLLTHVKIISRRMFPLGNHDITWGLDHEVLAQLNPITAHDGATSGVSRAMNYDLYRSFSFPFGRLILDTEAHPGKPDGTYDQTHFNMWTGAIHGESGMSIFLWRRKETANIHWYEQDDIATKPWEMEAVSRTHQQINRLLSDVIPLTEVEPEVRILYSRTSRLMDIDTHMKEAMEVYPSLLFSGAHVGFITERRLAGRQFGNCKVIVVPQVNYFPKDALQGLAEFAKAGGIVVFAGPSEFKTKRGLERTTLKEILRLKVSPGQKRPYGKGKLIGLKSALVGKRQTVDGGAPMDLPVEMETGKDKLMSLAATDNWVMYEKAISKILDDVRIDRCPGYSRGVEARRYVDKDGSELRAYLNYSMDKPVTIEVPKGSVELITRKNCNGEITLKPLGVALVKIAK